MEPKETHNKIEELLSAAVDGEVSVEEHAQAEEALNSPEWASHAAFLSILKDSARFVEDPIEVPASLSERIALATYARPTLWSRITGALRPAPMRYAAGGLALSGLAAIGLVMLKPPSVTHIPNAPVATPKAPQVARETPPTPDVQPITPKPSPEPVIQDVKPTPEPPTTPEVIRTPAPAIRNPRNDTVAPPVTEGTKVATERHNPIKSVLPDVPKAKPTPGPTRKPTVLAPARMADPGTEAPVAVETPAPTAVATGNTTGITEGTPDLVAPRPVTIASGITDPAAAHREPSNTSARTTKNDPDAVMKISLNQGREKLNGLSGQPAAGSASGSRMSLVNDNEKR